MSVEQEYNEIYNKEIIQKTQGIILSYSPLNDKFEYKPFSHCISNDSVERLGELMKRNLYFYSFGEDEIVEYYKNDSFDSLEQAVKYAYKNRVPHRAKNQDGLPSEVLLDLLIQLYNPNAYKLAVRTIFRQNDNNEIKGYDLSYFTKENEKVELWLGQAKLGSKRYCKSGINKDLVEKYLSEYLAEQLYFVCNKRVAVTDDAKYILAIIEKLNIRTIDEDSVTRANRLIELLMDHRIRIKIPCLLAYDEANVYKDVDSLCERVLSEVNDIKDYFNSHKYSFTGFSPDIVFYVFPIENIERLRDEENGFYAGLY